MGLYLGGLIIGRIFASEIWGASVFSGGLIFWRGEGGGGGLLSDFYGILISFNLNVIKHKNQ